MHIDHIFCLPVPDKAKPQHNLVVIPKQDIPGAEPVVWTALEVNPKAPNPQQGPEAMTKNLDGQLAKFGKQVTWPNDEEFVGAAAGPKGSKSYGVRAHRGSKEGMQHGLILSIHIGQLTHLQATYFSFNRAFSTPSRSPSSSFPSTPSRPSPIPAFYNAPSMSSSTRVSRAPMRSPRLSSVCSTRQTSRALTHTSSDTA